MQDAYSLLSQDNACFVDAGDIIQQETQLVRHWLSFLMHLNRRKPIGIASNLQGQKTLPVIESRPYSHQW
jgi:hypothetical protein